MKKLGEMTVQELQDLYDVENYLQAVADNLYDMSEWESDGTTVVQTIRKEYK